MVNWELYGPKCYTTAACTQWAALNDVQYAEQRKAFYFNMVAMSLKHHTGFATSPEQAQK